MNNGGGAPKGNTNASRTKRWREALDKALKRFECAERKVRAGEALNRIAWNLVANAIEGDEFAITEIGNRLDGKPQQSIDVSGEITHARQLSDAQILEWIERARPSAGALEPPTGEEDPTGVH